MLRLLAALLALVPSASSRRQRGKVSTAAAANSGGRSPLLPGLGSPLHEVGDIGTFDELAMRAIMARPDRVAVKFDMAGVCASSPCNFSFGLQSSHISRKRRTYVPPRKKRFGSISSNGETFLASSPVARTS